MRKPLTLLAAALLLPLSACAVRAPLDSGTPTPTPVAGPAGHLALDGAHLRAHATTWERLLAAEDARAATDAQLGELRAGLSHPSPQIRTMAVRALGRLERPVLAADIVLLLRDASPDVRAHAANALAQAARGGAVDRAPIAAALSAEDDPSAATTMAEAAGRMRHGDTGEGRATALLLSARLVAATDLRERLGIVRGLYFLARQQGMRPAFDANVLAPVRAVATSPSPDDGGVETLPARLRALAVATLAAAGAADAPLLEAALRDPAWTVRREAVVATGTLQDTAQLRRLLTLGAGMRDGAGQVRLEALRVYGRRLAASHGCGPARAAVSDPDAHVRLLAIDLLGSSACRAAAPASGADPTAAAAAATQAAGDVAVLDSLAARVTGPQWHAGARALVALAARDTAAARRRLAALGSVADPFARVYVARAHGAVQDTLALRRLATDEDVNVRTAAVQALAAIAGRAADDVYMLQLQADDSQLLQAAAAALEGSPMAGAPGALLDALDRVSARREETSRDARRALLRRAGELGSLGDAARVRPYLRDFDPVIAALAADVLANWTGQRPEPAPQPLDRLPLPSFAEAAALAESRVVIEMMDGARVVLRLLPFEAPTNAFRFARLAQDGWYDGLTLHRVVPNFVVQGGSPRANEYAGHGPFSRDELGLAGNWRGTVGLSTRGRDTGDAQLFINTVDNVRLDHDYTIFAEVVEGMDVVDRMLEGARMRTVCVVRHSP